jgi:hypothetical protein
MSISGPLPPVFADTRGALHLVAVHILARRRVDLTGRVGLRASPGGFAIPASGDGAEVVRTDGDLLVIERGGTTTAVVMSSLGGIARVAGLDLTDEVWVGADTPPVGDPDAPLAIDPVAARALGGWFAFTTAVLDRVVAGLGAEAAASEVQLWPEHFDVACHVAWGPAEGQRVNLGGSPGDGHHADPYLYIGPWGTERPGDPSFWNAPFGALLGYDRMVAAGGLEQARDVAVRFFAHGLALLARP